MENINLDGMTKEELAVQFLDIIADIISEWADIAPSVYYGEMTHEEAFKRYDEFLKPYGYAIYPYIAAKVMVSEGASNASIVEMLKGLY